MTQMPRPLPCGELLFGPRATRSGTSLMSSRSPSSGQDREERAGACRHAGPNVRGCSEHRRLTLPSANSLKSTIDISS